MANNHNSLSIAFLFTADLQSHLCNQKLDHVFHTLLYQLVYLGVELFLQREEKVFFLTKHN